MYTDAKKQGDGYEIGEVTSLENDGARVDNGSGRGADDHGFAAETEDRTTRRDLVFFFLLGLINNASFVIFVASAKEIAANSVALVYLCASVPSFATRISAPYWFDRVSYKTRMRAAAVLMGLSFTGVALAPVQALQFIGVMLTSAQQGLGEATVLSLCTRFGNKGLTAWSSGTGVAGLFGYAWVVVFRTWMGLPFRFVILLANVLTVGYLIAFASMNPPPEVPLGASDGQDAAINGSFSIVDADDDDGKRSGGHRDVLRVEMTAKERLFFSLSLWRTTVPLILVYFAEYAAQSGAWAAIGFPTDDKNARELFYEYANWCYQGGVFVSRSSGELWKPSRAVLWGMSILQCAVLVFFVLDAIYHFWYDYSLLSLAFFTGLLGGSVYVNAFRLIRESVAPHMREIASTAGAVSSDFGTNMGEALGLGIQILLYRANNI